MLESVYYTKINVDISILGQLEQYSILVFKISNHINQKFYGRKTKRLRCRNYNASHSIECKLKYVFALCDLVTLTFDLLT